MAANIMEKYSYAYVRYLDAYHINTLKVVEIGDIKRFDADSHHPEKVYKVKWVPPPKPKTKSKKTNSKNSSNDSDIEMESSDSEPDVNEEGYYKAQILKLSHSREDMEKSIQEGSRLVFKKREFLNTSVEETEDDSEDTQKRSVKRVLDFTHANKKGKTKHQDEARSKELGSILAKMTATRKPLLAGPVKKKPKKSDKPATKTNDRPTTDKTTTNVTTNMTPNTTTNTTTDSPTLTALRTKYKVKEAENKMLKKKVEELTNLNFRLQREVLDVVGKNAKAATPSNFLVDAAVPPSAPTPRTFFTPKVVSSPQTTGATCSESIYRPVDGKVALGEDVSITTAQWEILSKQKSNSMYVKTLATMIWGTALLKEKSLFGRQCPRHKKLGLAPVVKEPLTPKKLACVRECYRHHLLKKGLSAEEEKKVLGKMNGFISEKIQDLNRS